MHIAYSSLRTPCNGGQQSSQPGYPARQLFLRRQAYQTVCSKYRNEIAAIQKYFPGWQPSFPA